MIQLTEEQQTAADVVRRSQFSLLTGGPGVGKTTTLSSVAREFQLGKTFFCAPTGRAAQRMNEALGESGLSFKASTIHSMLIPQRNGHDKGGWGFGYNKFERLPAEVVVCDEVSMCDNAIMAALLTALPDDCKVILVGDPDQLAPVGVGAALRDMIASGHVPHARLTQVHRFAGRIAHVCKQINQGKRWMPSVTINDSPDAGEFGPENLKHMERKNPGDCIEAMLATIDALITRRGFHPLDDIQVLCSRNDQGALSRVKLNEHLQKALNKDGETLDGCPFRMGDKVMCLQNGFRESYDREITERLGLVYVANGEIGVVRRLSKKEVFCEFGGIMIKFPKGEWERQMALSYAITTWKAQGGGWPCVLHMIDEARNVDRSLVYTSLSRGKKFVFTFGRLQTLFQQCERVLLATRKTRLVERIEERMVV